MEILLITVAIALLLFFVLRFIVHPVFLSPLSKIPNAHFTAPFSHAWIRYQRRGHRTSISPIFKAHKAHGPVVRISPDEVSVASLDGLRQIYMGAFEKDEFFSEFANYGIPNLVSMMGNKEHSVQKRMMSHVYSKSFIQNSEDLRTLSQLLILERILPVLQHSADEGEMLDMFGLNGALGVDFMTSYMLGFDTCPDFIRHPVESKEFLDSRRVMSLALPGHEEARKIQEKFILSRCRTVGQEGSKATAPVVFGQLSQRLQKSVTPYPILEQTASELLDHLIAATETIRTVLTYVQWELCPRPPLQAALRKELRSVQGSWKANLPDPRELDALPLLDAIIKESLRRYPATLALSPRVTPPQGAVIDGYAIPGGTTVGTSAYCLHYNEDIFPEPETFDPYRWLNEKRKVEMNRWWWGFGSGGRMCIGSHFAIYVLKYVLGVLYANFETEVVEHGDMQQEDTFLSGPKGAKLVLGLKAVG